jgi:lipopolysaccharide export LptBFGC system permease protein LptF
MDFKSNILTSIILSLMFLGCDEKEIKQTLFLTPNAENGKDAIIAKAYSNNNYGSYEKLHLISRIKFDSIEDDNRFAVNFNILDFEKKSKIDSAFIYLFNTGQKNYGERSFLIQRIIYPWKESRITWKNRPAVDTINQIKVVNSNKEYQDYKINVTSIVEKITSNKQRNLGFMFRLFNENLVDKRINFYSSNCTMQDKRPKLEIYYRVRK